jgi:hypothetical protein
LLLCSSYLPLGVPNWTMIYINTVPHHSHITPEACMVMKKASGGDFPLRQGVGKSFWTHPISRRRRWRLAVCFVENSSGLRFSSPRRLYRRKGGVRRWARWPHHLVAWARGWPRHPMVWLAPGPLPSVLWAPSRVGKNRNFGFYFVQFREYFLCSFSKTQKQQKIGNWHCGIVNRLVSENA